MAVLLPFLLKVKNNGGGIMMTDLIIVETNVLKVMRIVINIFKSNDFVGNGCIVMERKFKNV